MLKKNIWASFQRILELFTQKFGFGIRVQGSKRLRIPNLLHWAKQFDLVWKLSQAKQNVST